MKNHLLAFTRRTIPYSPELRPIAGSVTASILMQQLDYWFSKMPNGFYKFLAPCSNEFYKSGDSWEEELAFSADEFRTAFDRIGVRHISKKAYKAAESSATVFIQTLKDGTTEEKFYASYHDKIKGLTFYFRNHPFTDATLDALISKGFPVNREIPSTEMKPPTPPSTVNRESQSTEMDISSYVTGKSPAHLYQEITQEITPKGEEEEEEEEPSPKETGKPPAPNLNASVATLAKPEELVVTPINSGEGRSSATAVATVNYAALGMQDPNNRKTRQQREFNWVPEGPWQVEGKLDSNFLDWLTAKWVRDYGKDVHTTRANVQRHLKKDAANFAIAWDEYHREHLHRYSNAAVRERSGGVLGQEEQQRLLQHNRAVTQAVPEELASVAYTLPTAVEEFTPDIAEKLTIAALPENFEGSPSTYQEWKPKELTEEDQLATIQGKGQLSQQLAELTRKRSMTKLPPSPPSFETIFARLESALQDPVFRADTSVQQQAQKFVGENDGYCADYDSQGRIVAIYKF